MRGPALVLAVFFVCGPPVAFGRSLERELSNAFSERQARFAATLEQDRGALKTAIETINAVDDDKSTNQSAAVQALYDAANNFGRDQGAFDAIQRASQYLLKRPNFTQYQFWANDQVGQIKALSEASKDAMDSAARLSKDSASDRNAMVKAFVNAWFLRAYAKAVIDEFERDDHDFGVYFSARSDLDAKRRSSVVASLNTIGSALQAASPPPSFPPSVRTTCRQVGNQTNCVSQ